MFKRRPKPRDDDIAKRALEKVEAQSGDQQEATQAFAAGQQAEADGEPEAAIDAYLASGAAWERYHEATGHPVPPQPYLRLGILLRRAGDLEAEIRVLEAYLASAGRDPDFRVQERLQRAYERLEG